MSVITSYRFHNFNSIHDLITYWLPMVLPIVTSILTKRKSFTRYLRSIYGICWFSYHLVSPIVFAFMWDFFSFIKLSKLSRFFENKTKKSLLVQLFKFVKEHPYWATKMFMKISQLNSAGVF